MSKSLSPAIVNANRMLSRETTDEYGYLVTTCDHSCLSFEVSSTVHLYIEKHMTTNFLESNKYVVANKIVEEPAFK